MRVWRGLQLRQRGEDMRLHARMERAGAEAGSEGGGDGGCDAIEEAGFTRLEFVAERCALDHAEGEVLSRSSDRGERYGLDR